MSANIATVRDRLGAHLNAIDWPAGILAARAGVTMRQAMIARCGSPVETVAFLRICASIAFDPLPQITTLPTGPAEFDATFFAMALRLRRKALKHNVRQAAKLNRLSFSTISRMENGRAVSIESTLQACVYIGAHPFSYFNAKLVAAVAAPIPRETASAG